jgi:hypothetical protein
MEITMSTTSSPHTNSKDWFFESDFAPRPIYP